jgi:hypothetical protein
LQQQDLFKPLIYFLLQLPFVFVIQPVLPAFRGMKKTAQHTIYPTALPLEQPADRTSGKVDSQLDPLPDRE